NQRFQLTDDVIRQAALIDRCKTHNPLQNGVADSQAATRRLNSSSATSLNSRPPPYKRANHDHP
ncbi:MAG: hypothetical protein K2X58_14365, partial [Pseudomonadaceae bacterium]|nr:hypothetical protein [Pseudomonadaceae bacterium]